MATKLKRKVARETNFTFMGRYLVLTLVPASGARPDMIYFKCKGKKKGVYQLDVPTLFTKCRRID